MFCHFSIFEKHSRKERKRKNEKSSKAFIDVREKAEKDVKSHLRVKKMPEKSPDAFKLRSEKSKTLLSQLKKLPDIHKPHLNNQKLESSYEIAK